MPNFLQVLHWGQFTKIINVSGIDAQSAELKKIKGVGGSFVAGGAGDVNKTSASGNVNRVGGGGSTSGVSGKGNVCG